MGRQTAVASRPEVQGFRVQSTSRPGPGPLCRGCPVLSGRRGRVPLSACGPRLPGLGGQRPEEGPAVLQSGRGHLEPHGFPSS